MEWKKRIPFSVLLTVLGIACVAFFANGERLPLERGLIALGFSFGLFGGFLYCLMNWKGLLYGLYFSLMLCLGALVSSTDVGMEETKIYALFQSLLFLVGIGWVAWRKIKSRKEKECAKSGIAG